MIKSEVLNKDTEGMHVSVAISGEKREIYAEIKGLLRSFAEDPDLALLILRATRELREKAKEDK